MLPYIGATKSKKKIITIGTDEMIKQWANITKELAAKAKPSLSQIKSNNISDYFKVCRLKEIPDFYSNYFIVYVAKTSQHKAEAIIEKEIRALISQESYYHKIQRAIESRNQQVNQLANVLSLVQGFQAMNLGKPANKAVRQQINELLKEAKTLEELKQIENTQNGKLGSSIIQVRKKTQQLTKLIKEWRNTLHQISDSPSLNRIKIIHPHHHINCLLVTLNDMSFFWNSFLTKEYQISPEKNPFLLITKDLKPRAELHEKLATSLNSDLSNYQEETKYIIRQIPGSESQNKMLEQLEQEKLKELKALKQKERSEKQKTIIQTNKKKKVQKSMVKQQKQKSISSPKNNKDEVKRSNSVIDIENLFLKGRRKQKLGKKQENNKSLEISKEKGGNSISKESPQKVNKSSTIKGIYSNKKMDRTNQLQSVKNEKKHLEQQLKQAEIKNKQYERLLIKLDRNDRNKRNNRNEAGLDFSMENSPINRSINLSKSRSKDRISAIYSPKSRPNISLQLQHSEQMDTIKAENKMLEKQLKNEQKSKMKMEGLLKKSEKQLVKKQQTIQKTKEKYEEQLGLLRSQVSAKDNHIQNPLLKHKNKSIGNLYTNTKVKKLKSPETSQMESRLIDEKAMRGNLQRQIKELIKEKNKLEKVLEKSESQVTKQKQANQRKIQKYQKIINDLKNQRSPRKKSASIREREANKKPEGLRMYTTSPAKPKNERSSSRKKTNKSNLSANFFKLPPEIKKMKTKQTENIPETIQQQNENQKPITIKKTHNVEIIQTKKTIEIVYENSRRKNKAQKPNQEKSHQKKPDIDDRHEEFKLKKQKQLLHYKMEREENRRRAEERQQQRKLQREQEKILKYQEMVQKQRNRKLELEQRMKNMKRELYDQYENKLRAEKQKFNHEKKQLLVRIENEKEERLIKQKHLSNQIKFLREMQANENQLIKLLETEKHNRKQKEQQLAEEIAKKEELMTILQIEQIKKGIENEVRKELQDSDQQSSTDNQFFERKEELQKQIDEMNDERQMELEEIDEQNQKLKNLIERIKGEEQKLINIIKQNIQDESQVQNIEGQGMTDREQQFPEREEAQKQQRDGDNNQNEYAQVDLNNVEEIFKSRLHVQEQHQRQMKQFYQNLSSSPTYKEKSDVENLIQKYLEDPHQYPSNKQLDLSKKDKQKLEDSIINKSKLVGDFEKELMNLKKVQSFVPTNEDDIMTSHLLNLKKVYEKQTANALRDQLFPSIMKDDGSRPATQLSYQSEETPPPVTIREHVQVHAKKFVKKNTSNKNFLAINKMRLAALEENRKDKEKQLIYTLAQKNSKSLKKRKNQSLKKKGKEESEKQNNLDQEASKQKINQNKEKTGFQKAKHSKTLGVKYKSKNDQQEKQDKDKKQELENKTDRDEPSQQQQIHQQQIRQTDNQKLDFNSNNQVDIDGAYHSKEEVTHLNDNQNTNDKKEEENIKQQEVQEGNNEIKTEDLVFTNQHSSLDKQRELLQQDIRSYQQSIRSYISGEERFDIYQHFVTEQEIQAYIKDLIDISSNQIKGLNHNSSLKQDILQGISIVILIAKDYKSGMQIGIGIFHKEYNSGKYICDYMIAHNMRNFLNLAFNFSRYIFTHDKMSNKIEYFFDINKLEDEISIVHFLEFEEKCKRLGEVYMKSDANKIRKYVLRRNLFQEVQQDQESAQEGHGLQFNLKIRFHSDHFKEKGYGFNNIKSPYFFSINTLAADYIRRDEQRLERFRSSTESDLDFRELLITTLMFQKKQVQIKKRSINQIPIDQRIAISKDFFNIFTIQDAGHMMQLSEFNIGHGLAVNNSKRCTFDVDDKQIKYIINTTGDPVSRIQSSNSSEIGLFMSLIPKYKLLMIDGNQFLSMSKVNPQMNIFFYVKHFIKNIVDVQKESYPRVFIPEFHEANQYFFKDLSEKLKGNVFAEEDIKIGWENNFSNSIIFTPTHKDLVIKKPFIVALMSATIEKAIEGTPICASLIQ